MYKDVKILLLITISNNFKFKKSRKTNQYISFSTKREVNSNRKHRYTNKQKQKLCFQC